MGLAPCPTEPEFDAVGLALPAADAIPAEFLKLCRYKNILPTKRTIVTLQPLPGTTGESRSLSTFINANYLSGYDGSTRYIATQGPKKETVDAFWRMVWENKVNLVAMLTGMSLAWVWWFSSPGP